MVSLLVGMFIRTNNWKHSESIWHCTRRVTFIPLEQSGSAQAPDLKVFQLRWSSTYATYPTLNRNGNAINVLKGTFSRGLNHTPMLSRSSVQSVANLSKEGRPWRVCICFTLLLFLWVMADEVVVALFFEPILNSLYQKRPFLIFLSNYQCVLFLNSLQRLPSSQSKLKEPPVSRAAKPGS